MPTRLVAIFGMLFALLTFISSPVLAADDAGAQVTRPAGYQPRAGDARLGEKLFNSTKLSTNGMACATCHANHGAFQASFAKPYPHTVQMAKNQLGRNTVHLDEMIQVCMMMPMETQPLPWNSRELAALVAYVRIQQRSFKPSSTPTPQEISP